MSQAGRGSASRCIKDVAEVKATVGTVNVSKYLPPRVRDWSVIGRLVGFK